MEFLRLRSSEINAKCLFVGLFVLLFSTKLFAAEVLTETKSIELGLNQTEFNQLLQSRVDAARGKLRAVDVWDNPVIEISREEAGNETEYGLWLRQSFQLSGQRSINIEAAQTAVTEQEAVNALQRTERIAQIRGYFYQVLFYQRQQLLFKQWLEKVSVAESAIEKREIAGDASGYDRRRISRERLDLQARLRRSEMELFASHEQLLGVIASDAQLQIGEVTGELLPQQQHPFELLLEKLDQHSMLLQLQRQSDVARLEAHAFARAGIPDLTLGIGQKYLDSPGENDTGLMLSASLPLPVFNRKQGEHERAIAQAQQLQSEYRLRLRQLQSNVRSLWHKADQQRKNTKLFAEQSVGAATEIVEIAEASYYASEIGVLELIDAYRSALDAELSVLQMALDSRLLRIDLDKMTEGYTS